ncbi:MAG: hypothetical protein K0A90_00170 [Methanosarcinaceae archaeon]|nr:hypothetical protein [Methanosarcinaceae archaeon]
MVADEKILLKSFGFNQINDNEMRKFECWGSVEVLDRADEIIPAEEIYKIMDIWMDRGAPIQFMHTNRNVGKGLNWQRSEKNGRKGVLITGIIYKHYTEDDTVWEGIKKGEFEGLSIGGKSFNREKTKEGTYLRDLIGYEFSLVDHTGNQEATFTEVNVMAKKNVVKADETPMMEDKPIVDVESKISALENMITSIIDKITMLEGKLSGAPEGDTPVEDVVETEKAEDPEAEDVETSAEEEEKADDATEEDKPDDDVTKLATEMDVMKKEISDLKKSMVTKTIMTSRPAEIKKTNKITDVRKSLQDMAKSGKIDFASLGSQMRAI